MSIFKKKLKKRAHFFFEALFLIFFRNFCDIFKKYIDICVITYSDKENYESDKNLEYKLIRVKRTNKLLKKKMKK